MAQAATDHVRTAAWHPANEVPVPPEVAAMGSCRLGKRLDDGGANEVYQAIYPGMRSRAAIKFLRRAAGVEPGAREACRQDADLVAGCGHPNIASVIASGVTTEGVPFVLREYVEGETLQAYLARRGRIAPAEAVHLIESMAAALRAAHELGVIHGELRPGKVFLQRAAGYPGGFLKIVDFGLWRLTGERRGPGAVAGVARYTSPELLAGSGAAADARMDQFTLAAIAYRMIAGVDAFAGDDVAAVLDAVLHRAPRPLDSIIPCHLLVGAVIRRGLARDPAQRFESVQAFSAALREAVDNGPPEITRPISPAQIVSEAPATQPPARWEPGELGAGLFEEDERPAYPGHPGRRQRPGAVAVAVVLLCLGGGIAWSAGWRPTGGWTVASLWAEVTGR